MTVEASVCCMVWIMLKVFALSSAWITLALLDSSLAEFIAAAFISVILFMFSIICWFCTLASLTADLVRSPFFVNVLYLVLDISEVNLSASPTRSDWLFPWIVFVSSCLSMTPASLLRASAPTCPSLNFGVNMVDMTLGPLRVCSVWFLRCSIMVLTSSNVRGFTFPYMAWAISLISLLGDSSTAHISMLAAWILISLVFTTGTTCFGLLRFAVLTLVPFFHLTSNPSSLVTSSSLVSMSAMRSSSSFSSLTSGSSLRFQNGTIISTSFTIPFIASTSSWSSNMCSSVILAHSSSLACTSSMSLLYALCLICAGIHMARFSGSPLLLSAVAHDTLPMRSSASSISLCLSAMPCSSLRYIASALTLS